MKLYKICLLMLFLVYTKLLHSQECLNSNWTIVCNGTEQSADNCATWITYCGKGWKRSNGTPELKPYSYTIGSNTYYSFFMFLWSNGSIGEGIFTNHTFTANKVYNVHLAVSSNNGNGTIYVYAANGLNEAPVTLCGTSLPSIAQKQLIGQYNGYTNGWNDLSFSFTPNSTYNQLWIYPLGSSTPQYEISIANVQACASCDGTIYYDNGVLPPIENRAGTFFVGSTARLSGYGVVEVQPDLTTALIATNEIVFLPEFDATVSTGEFSASIESCGSTSTLTSNSQFSELPMSIKAGDETSSTKTDQSPSLVGIDLLGESNQSFRIYPTIGTGFINITGAVKELEKCSLTIYDQTGRQVYRTVNGAAISTMSVDLSHLPNGVYLLQINNAVQKRTCKIIIQK